MRDWQVIFKDNRIYRAEIVKAILDDKEMSPVLINKQDSAYQLGYYEIMVPAEHVLRALKVVNEEIDFE